MMVFFFNSYYKNIFACEFVNIKGPDPGVNVKMAYKFIFRLNLPIEVGKIHKSFY